MIGKVGASGALNMRVIRAPKIGLDWKVRNFRNVWPGLWRRYVAKILRMSHLEGKLYARLVRADGSVLNYGLVSTKLVTTAFVNNMVDELQSVSEWGDYDYHDCGTGTTGAAVGDTAMETQYGGARQSGTPGEGASANIYQSVGTISFTGSLAITEHGLFNNLTGATLMDRHTFAAINVGNGDSIEFTYELTCTAGG